jgi:hypothetical protein
MLVEGDAFVCERRPDAHRATVIVVTPAGA